jgi:hypothetical protein
VDGGYLARLVFSRFKNASRQHSETCENWRPPTRAGIVFDYLDGEPRPEVTMQEKPPRAFQEVLFSSAAGSCISRM